MKIKNIIIILFLLNSFLLAQAVKVVETSKLEVNEFSGTYYPQFSKDDSKIIFSSADYKGLYSYDLNSNSTSVISDIDGAGYNPLILNERNIIYRTSIITNGRKFHSIKSFDLSTGKNETLESNRRSLKLPKQLPGNNILLVENTSPLKKEYDNLALQKSAESKAVYVEDNGLFVVIGDEINEINPLGKGVYVWESLSNDGNRILFTFGNQGAFICDLSGNILYNIKDAHFPKFSPDGKYVSYMIDEDDGYKYVSSDIYIYSIEQNKSYPVTNTLDKVEMYAEWSNNGNKLIYNTADGELYISTIKFEN